MSVDENWQANKSDPAACSGADATENTSESSRQASTAAPKRQVCDGRGELLERDDCVEHCMDRSTRHEIVYFDIPALGEECVVCTASVW